MKIGILVVGTGNYRHYFPNLYYTMKKRFLKNHEKMFFFFTDVTEKMPPDVAQIQINRRGFPGDTLLRYHYFCGIDKHLRWADVLYYIDVDSFVNEEVGDEILPDNKGLIAVAHPGFYNNRTPTAPLGTPETRPESTAYISTSEKRPCYWMGGFTGGRTEDFLNLSMTNMKNIDKDLENDIVAVWHDESHLNRYLTSNQENVKTLLPSYGYPESWDLGMPKKILMLDKDHEAIRK